MGRLIVIEGIDGSGKNTQSTLLVENLNKIGFLTSKMSFPAYEQTFFGAEVGKYLDGAYGGIDDIPAQFAAMLYAGDRFEKRNEILNLIQGDGILIVDRYVPSNIAHQCAKVPPEERPALKEWIERLEYDVYKIPKPDMVIFLDVPANISQRLVSMKDARSYTSKKHDLHEDSVDHLKESHRCFRDLISQNQWSFVECATVDGMKSIETIQSDILDLVLANINAT